MDLKLCERQRARHIDTLAYNTQGFLLGDKLYFLLLISIETSYLSSGRVVFPAPPLLHAKALLRETKYKL